MQANEMGWQLDGDIRLRFLKTAATKQCLFSNLEGLNTTLRKLGTVYKHKATIW